MWLEKQQVLAFAVYDSRIFSFNIYLNGANRGIGQLESLSYFRMVAKVFP